MKTASSLDFAYVLHVADWTKKVGEFLPNKENSPFLSLRKKDPRRLQGKNAYNSGPAVKWR